MTVEVDTNGPGIEYYRSQRFAAAVNSTTSYVYGWEDMARFATQDWDADEDVELSWLKFFADEDVTVTVTLADATPITSYHIDPGHIDLGESIVGGALVFQMPTGTKPVLIELNGDSANVLVVCSQPLLDEEPSEEDRVSWTDLSLEVVSVSTGADTLTTESEHGYNVGDRVILNATPTTEPGDIDLPEGLAWFVPYEVASTPTATTLTLRPMGGGSTINIASAPGDPFFIQRQSHIVAASILYFGPGRHIIGHDFELDDSCDVYLSKGAVLCGAFRMFDVDGIDIYGGGGVSGEGVEFETISALAFAQQAKYIVFNGDTDANFATTNTVAGITVFATPFHISSAGAWSYRYCQAISPWHENTDAFVCARKDTTTYLAEIVGCFSYVGDDNLHCVTTNKSITVSGCHAQNIASSILHFGYSPFQTKNPAYGSVVSDVDVRHRALQTEEFSQILRCWPDGNEVSQRGTGFFNVRIRGLRVWGTVAGRVLDIRNYSPTWDGDIRDRVGHIANWQIDGLFVESEPGLLSIVEGRDSRNTPCDITLNDVEIGGVRLTGSNLHDYIDLSDECYMVLVNNKVAKNR